MRRRFPIIIGLIELGSKRKQAAAATEGFDERVHAGPVTSSQHFQFRQPDRIASNSVNRIGSLGPRAEHITWVANQERPISRVHESPNFFRSHRSRSGRRARLDTKRELFEHRVETGEKWTDPKYDLEDRAPVARR